MKERNLIRTAAFLLCLLLGGALLPAVLHYAVPILLPFLLSYLLSVSIRPVAKKLSALTHLPTAPCAVVLFLLLLAILLAGLGTALALLAGELSDLVDELLAGEGLLSQLLDTLSAYSDRLAERFPLLLRFTGGLPLREQLTRWLSQLLNRLLTAAGEQLPGLVGDLLSGLPRMLLSLVAVLFSGVWFCMGTEELQTALCDFLPPAATERLHAISHRLKGIAWGYLRSYFWLWLLTFAELWLGLSVLSVKYAFLAALLISLVDLLPVLGVGTVLLPWSALAFFAWNNRFLGIGLLVLDLVILLVRQLTEPRLVGHTLGLHPLLTLFFGYAGFRLFGMTGLFLLPPLAVLGKELWRQWQQSPAKVSSSDEKGPVD